MLLGDKAKKKNNFLMSLMWIKTCVFLILDIYLNFVKSNLIVTWLINEKVTNYKL